MKPARHLVEVGRHLHAILGAPGLMIGVFSLLTFGFGLFVLASEYDRPRQTGRGGIHTIVADWVRLPDYLGLTLVDYADLWREASLSDRTLRQSLIAQALTQLGNQLDRQSERFPLIHVVSMELVSTGVPPLATWRAPVALEAPETEVIDELELIEAEPPNLPAVSLRVRYRIAPAFESAARSLETSYRRLLLALLGLSGFSLLCLGYMILHAQALSERVAREAAQEATLDLADRTCHELGNGVFVLTNERRNLAEHLDIVERFLTEEPLAREAAVKRIGLDADQATRLIHALRREYAARGIDPDLELRGSAAIARHVCRQIDVCSEYIGLTVRELDSFLKRSEFPVAIEHVDVSECVNEALALLYPRLEAAEAKIILHLEPAQGRHAHADRRLLIHALVNLIKNALEAVAGFSDVRRPEIRLSATIEGRTVHLTIADNGPGIPPDRLKHIFEPNFSTKGPGRGRGLAIVRESIYVQEGEITVSSEPLQGTRFQISLTLVSEALPKPHDHDDSGLEREATPAAQIDGSTKFEALKT